IMDRLAYKFAITEENAFLNGTGSDQPLGVFTASTMGISTNRDTAAASHTAIGADDLINVKYALKAQYQEKAVWILHRTIVQAIRKLKDANNNYLWTVTIPGWGGATGPGQGLQGTPENLLDRPVYMSEYAPNTISQGLYTAILGDFSRYIIVDALDMQFQVLDQLYAATNQTGYIARRELDGMPVLRFNGACVQ
ncbi:MAG TPA: phage major capsid protein, partial [Chthonomonadaceae bacterium]|nr:phage major capsid protein [Chthonomonadaceae bacterium]